MRERTYLNSSLSEIRSLGIEFLETLGLIELAEAESDEEILAEAEDTLKNIHNRAAKAELQTLLSGEADANDCYLEIHAGAGGTEAQDWAEMLARMYSR